MFLLENEFVLISLYNSTNHGSITIAQEIYKVIIINESSRVSEKVARFNSISQVLQQGLSVWGPRQSLNCLVWQAI